LFTAISYPFRKILADLQPLGYFIVVRTKRKQKLHKAGNKDNSSVQNEEAQFSKFINETELNDKLLLLKKRVF